MCVCVCVCVCALSMRVGGIVEPGTLELYLRAGDPLNLVCEQRVTPTTVDKVIRWSKAESKAQHATSLDVHISDDQLRYQTIDTGLSWAPYNVNEFPAEDGGNLLRSELLKDNVGRADSGYYRCRLGLGGESSRILVTVIDSTFLSRRLSPTLLLKLPSTIGLVCTE